MPVFCVTDAVIGDQLTVEQPTDWDAWMHYRFTRRMVAGGGAMPFDCRMRVTGFNLILFGVLMVKLLEIGLITPPVGMNVFAAKALVGDTIPLEAIFKGCGWFLVCEILVFVLLVQFPAITLTLPRALGLM
jgi:hypothetical protein